MNHLRKVLLAITIVMLTCIPAVYGKYVELNNGASVAAAGGETAQGIVKGIPSAHDMGKLSADWWQWAFSMPVDKNSLYDTADISKGQKGDVWFLGTNFEGGPITRTWTIPAGKYLLIPIQNGEISKLEAPYYGFPEANTPAELLKAANGYYDGTIGYIDWSTAKFAIDNTPIDLGDGTAFKAEWKLFPIGPLPAKNVLLETYKIPEATAGTNSQAAASGYWYLLDTSKLEPGAHTITIATDWWSGGKLAWPQRATINFNLV